MFSSLRWLFMLLLCLVGIGLYRGWFTVSSPSRDAQGDKVNFSLSIDAHKVEADAEQFKQKIAEKVAQRVKESEKATDPAAEKATAPEAK